MAKNTRLILVLILWVELSSGIIGLSNADNSTPEHTATTNAVNIDDWDTAAWDLGSTSNPPPSVAPDPAPNTVTPAPELSASTNSSVEPDFTATPSSVIALFPESPIFQVIPSKKNAALHPCSNCHGWSTPNKIPRTLQSPHNNILLQHSWEGPGKTWCFSCHNMDDPPGLQTLTGNKINFDQAYIVCAQCHAQTAKDWYFGTHGKRIHTWEGTRQALNCTACHSPHQPAILPRTAKPGPVIRANMRMPPHWTNTPLDGDLQHSAWQRILGHYGPK